jgi:hypothetical protein
MRPILFAILLFFSAPALTQAQNNMPPAPPEESDDRLERIQAARVAFLTSRLNLNTSQAQQFWPIFNEFEGARRKIRKQIRKLSVDNALTDASEEQMKADLRKYFQLKQEELDLEKTFSERFLKVISGRQLAEFYRSEKEFTKLLLKRLGEKRGRGKDRKERDTDY